MFARTAKQAGPLRRQVVRRFLLVALLPLALVGLLGSVQTYLFVSAQAVAAQTELANRVGREVQTFVSGFVADIELFAAASELIRKPTLRQKEALETLLGTLSAAEDLTIWQTHDRSRTSVSRSALSEGLSQPGADWDALLAAAIDRKQTQVGHIDFSDLQGQPLLSLAIPLVDLRTGEVTHILTTRQKLRPVWDLMSQESLRNDQSVYLVGPERTVLAHSDPSVVYARVRAPRQTAGTLSRGLDGQLVVSASADFKLKDMSLSVVSERPAAKALALAWRQSTLVLLVMLLAGLGAMWLGRAASRRTAQPIEQLANAVRAITQGDLDQQLAPSGADEIANLATDFNHMTTRLRTMLDGLTAQTATLQAEVQARGQAEAALQALNTDLESKVLARTSELQAANAQLEATIDDLRATQDKLVQAEKLAGLGGLVAGVAHELNTPIGNARLAADAARNTVSRFQAARESGLKRSDLAEFETGIQTGMDIVERNLERAATLISGFKQLAVDQTSYQRRRFALTEVLDEVSMALAPAMRSAHVKLNMAKVPYIEMDSFPGPLSQVLLNLIQNSLLHGCEGMTDGVVSLDVQEGVPGTLVISVGDNGKGIPPCDLSRVFDPFFTTRFGQGNSGLGLNIVHNLVTGLMGGHIQVASEVGRGTVFTIRLPLQAPAG